MQKTDCPVLSQVHTSVVHQIRSSLNRLMLFLVFRLVRYRVMWAPGGCRCHGALNASDDAARSRCDNRDK